MILNCLAGLPDWTDAICAANLCYSQSQSVSGLVSQSVGLSLSQSISLSLVSHSIICWSVGQSVSLSGQSVSLLGQSVGRLVSQLVCRSVSHSVSVGSQSVCWSVRRLIGQSVTQLKVWVMFLETGRTTTAGIAYTACSSHGMDPPGLQLYAYNGSAEGGGQEQGGHQQKHKTSNQGV